MAQGVIAAIPLQVLTPPRVVEELSSEIDKLAPTAFNQLDEYLSQIGKLAPPALNEYARDFWQRSVLFLDILRQFDPTWGKNPGPMSRGPVSPPARPDVPEEN